jgi:hypothetical protein
VIVARGCPGVPVEGCPPGCYGSSRNANTFDGALWWPEWAFQFFFFRFEIHNDVDLHLVDPSGTVRASSVSIPSVFERARVSGQVAEGTWKLRIRG